MTAIEILAPAKVNLFLMVLSRRKDSFHNILTLFERISLADKIRITKIEKGIEVSADKFITRSSKDNIAYKAADLLIRAKRLRAGVRIEIQKNIPIAAGLGGGSSDAAGVLMGMNRLFGLKLKKEYLMRLGRRLGADVPFFILEAPFAIGRSRGDRLEKSALKPCLWHVIIKSGSKLSTGDVYQEFDMGFKPNRLTKNALDAKIRLLLDGAVNFNTLESMLYNDLEDTVVEEKKDIGIIIKRLATSLGKKAILSGSGPSVFCLYQTRKEAIKAKRKLLFNTPVKERKDWQVFVAGTKG